MAFWDQTGDADGSSRGNYFPPEDGEFDVQINAVKHKQGHEGESVIVELTVLKSSNPEVAEGMSRSTAWNLTKHKEMALNNIKSFVCGIYSLPEADKGPVTKSKVIHISKRMVEADNPLGGVKVHLTTWGSKTKKGTDFTNMKWSPYRGEPDYVAPYPSAGSTLGAPPPPPAPPPPTSPYYPEGTSPGKGATHVLRNGAWVGL